jgi:hypothetical protein
MRVEMIHFKSHLTCLLILSFALSSTGCSTRYVGHKDELRPFKSEDLATEVKLSRQDALSPDRTTIGYLLSKTSPIVNRYRGVDTFKRSSWLGLGIVIGSAVVGWYGIDAWTNTPQTIPPYGDPNPNYEKDRQRGQGITLCAAGGVLAGAAVHFIANRELTKKTVKADTVFMTKPLPYSQIKIFQGDKAISNMQTDESGNFKVDLSPFLKDSYRGKDIDLKILASEYPSIVDQLSVPASFMMLLEQSRLWKNAGFDSDARQDWIDSGFLTPQAALPWKQAGLAPSEARTWSERGLSATQARERLDKERKAEAVARAREEARKRERENLKAQAQDMGTLILTNPYDVKGKVYEIVGTRFQLFGKSTALYEAGNFVFLADFGSSSAPYVLKGLARGADPYRYLTTAGAQNIVPSLRVLFWDQIGTN